MATTAGGAWRRGAAGPEPARGLVVRASLRTAVALGDGVDGLRAARLWMWDATTAPAPAAGGAWRRGTAGPDLGRAGRFGAWSCVLRWLRRGFGRWRGVGAVCGRRWRDLRGLRASCAWEGPWRRCWPGTAASAWRLVRCPWPWCGGSPCSMVVRRRSLLRLRQIWLASLRCAKAGSFLRVSDGLWGRRQDRGEIPA
jgi:hypothetical protein